MEGFSKVYQAVRQVERNGRFLGVIDKESNISYQQPTMVYGKIRLDNFILLNEKKLPHDIETLLQYAKPSAFGDLQSGQTIVDDTVRNSFEIVDGLTVDKRCRLNFEIFSHFVSQKLMNGKNISLSLEKLVIYPQNSFFALHQDTPKDGSVGTLICQLPFSYEGGEFVLTNGMEDFVMESDDQNTQFLAFYGNIKHRIDPVKKGVRCSVIFSITYDCNQDDNQDDDYHNDMNRGLERFIICKAGLFITSNSPAICSRIIDNSSHVDDLENYSTNTGILLCNKYSSFDVANRSFKGSDHEIVNLLDFTCKDLFHITYVPVIIFYMKTFMDDQHDEEYEKYKVYSFDAHDIEQLSLGRKVSNSDGKIFSFIGQCQEACVMSHMDAIERTGNECAPEIIENYYYAIACLLSPK